MSKTTGLKELIQSRGLRFDFVAKEIGIEVKTLRGIARGDYCTKLPVVKLLSQVLNVTEDELIKMGLMHERAG